MIPQRRSQDERTSRLRAIELREGAENHLETLLCRKLDSVGIDYDRRVINSCGYADVVTADTVYEIKNILTHDTLFKAFGQVTLYATALGKPRRVIVGRRAKGNEAMEAVIRSLGVEINVYPWSVAATD